MENNQDSWKTKALELTQQNHNLIDQVNLLNNKLNEKISLIKSMEKELEKSKRTTFNEYPSIKKHKRSSLVIMFIAKNEGVVLEEGDGYERGIYRNDWLEPSYEPITSPIVLSNK